MSNKPFYGHIQGDGHGYRAPLKATEVFNAFGGHFVTLSTGVAELADASDKVSGWAEVAKCDGFGKSYFTAVSSSDCFIINGADDVFRLPAVHTVSLTDLGKVYELAVDNSHTAMAVLQKVHNTGTNKSTGAVLVVGVDTEDIANTTLQVKLAPVGMAR